MASDPGVAAGRATLPRPGAAVRQRLESEAACIEQLVAASPPARAKRDPGADPLLPLDAALAAQLAAARSALLRACSLGQPGGGAARAPALAALALACRHETGVAPSRQQLLAVLAMHDGYAVELGYVNGRALVIGLCAMLHVWCGRPCHVVCASDYLAARDAEALSVLYRCCGCGTASLASGTPEQEVARRYQADILYATGRQLLSDFMRDQVLLGGASSALRRRLRAQYAAIGSHAPATRGTSVALIDDIDAVLVEEAASPVVISAAGEHTVLNDATCAARQVAEAFEAGRDYLLERQPLLQVHFTPAGEQLLIDTGGALPAYWQHPQRRHDLMAAALVARDGLQRDSHYVVQEGRVILTDDSVFRRLAGRVWHQGLLQAVEAREGIALTVPPRTVARAAYQSYFARYHWLAGAGSDLRGLAGELRRSYGLHPLSLAAGQSAPASTGQLARQYQFIHAADKLDALCAMVRRLNSDGLPVLVGAPRLTDLIAIGRALYDSGIACHVADGRQPAADAEVLAAIGLPGRVTLLTGGAGRNAERPEAAAEALAQPAVHALLFEHGDSRRADAAFFAWSGHGVAFASLDDEVLHRTLPVWAAWLPRVARAQPALRRRVVALMLRLAQWKAGRHGALYRQSLVLRENQLDEQLAFSKKT